MPSLFQKGLCNTLSRLSLQSTFASLSFPHRSFQRLSTLQAAFYVPLSWLLLSLLAALPFYLALELSFVDALFVAVAALTTTLPVFSPADIPPTLFLYQMALGWLGGLYYLVLLFTILPLVSGCFGITLTAKDISFSPVYTRLGERAFEAARLYILFSVLTFCLYLLRGLPKMSALWAMCGSVSTLGFGNFGHLLTNDTGMALPALAALFAGTSNLLWQHAYTKKSLRLLLDDTELRLYFRVLLVASLLFALLLYAKNDFPPVHAIEVGLFTSLSFLTTTGTIVGDGYHWSDSAHILALILAFFGPAVGSIGGGIGLLRLQVLFRLMRGELKRTLHPHMVIAVHGGNKSVPVKIMGRILIFFFLYVLTFFIATILLSVAGLDTMPAIALSAGALGSTGSLWYLFSADALLELSVWTKCLASFFMLVGRMEIFACLVLLGATLGRSAKNHWR